MIRQEHEPADDSDERRIADVFASHVRAADGILAAGDPEQIKAMYRDLGDELAAVIDHADETPSLSYPETQAAVANQLMSCTGLHLDAGCGPNPEASFRVARETQRAVVGVDIAHGMVSLARRVAEQQGIDFIGVVADAERLPFRDGSFGSIVCDDTIEHLPDDEAGVRELMRIATPAARIVLATPNRWRVDVVVARTRDLARGRRRPPAAYYAVNSHLREYTWRDLERLVAPHARVIARGFVPWSGDAFRRLATRVTRTRLGTPWRRVVLLTLEPIGPQGPGARSA